MVIQNDPDDEIRKKIQELTKYPEKQDQMIKAIKDNPQLKDWILSLDEEGMKDLHKITSGSPSSSASSPVSSRSNYSYPISTGSPASSSTSSPISSGRYGSSGGCFIATAAYGSPLAEHVMVLSAFRDHHLNKSSLGRAFIRFYYRCSPGIARFISHRRGLRKAVRALLMPLVRICNHIDR